MSGTPDDFLDTLTRSMSSPGDGAPEDGAPDGGPLDEGATQERRPRLVLMLGAGALVLAVLAALLGTWVVGGQSLGGDFPGPDVIVDGATLTASRALPVDLSTPVRTWLVPGGPVATRAKLSILVAGHSVYSASAPFGKAPVGPEHVALIDASMAQYLLAGRLTFELTLTGGTAAGGPAAVVGDWRFIGRAAEPSVLSLLGVVVVVLGLFSVACIGECVKSLRRRRRRVGDSAGVSASLLFLVLSLTGAAWLALGRQPSLTGIVLAAALAVVSGPCLVWGYYGMKPDAVLATSPAVMQPARGVLAR